MSNNAVVKAESIGLLVARESALGVQPTAAWQTLQPNAGGIGAFYLKNKTVARSPLTKLRQFEASEIVDADAMPTLAHDWTKDLIDAFAEPMFLAKAKQPGGTGTAYFTNNLAVPTITARTTSAYTVSANGALQAGTLVVPRGWVTGANATANGTLQVVGASSTGTSIPVVGGVAETPSGYTVTLEVAGFRGASGDIGIDVNGNLTSTALDFTTLGLTVGQVGWLGGTTVGTSFATTAYRGFFKIVAIATNLLTLSRRMWTVAGADTGTGKTIDIYYGRFMRNVAFGSTDYQEPSVQMELTYTGLSSGADEYVYAAGNILDQTKINMPSANLVTVDMTFIGTTVSLPSTSRATGGATAAGPLAIEGMTTVTKQLYEQIMIQGTEAIVSNDIEASTLTFMNHTSAQKQHGTLGTKRLIVGKAEAQLDVTAELTQDDALKACQNNTTLMYGTGLRNGDGGWFLDIPSCKCTDSPPSFPANGPVTLALKLQAFRDATNNWTLGMSMFPFLPAS